MVRLTCPKCETRYTAERCGVTLPEPGRTKRATVVCITCKTQFDTLFEYVNEERITSAPGWWARNVMRRKPVVETSPVLRQTASVRG